MKTLFYLLLITPVLLPAQNRINAYECWFDGDTLTRQIHTVTPAGIFTLEAGIPATALTEGLHQVHIRLRDDSGRFSLPVSQYFFKKGGAAESAAKVNTLQYWFNNAVSQATWLSYTGAPALNISTGIQTGNLPAGLNQLHFRVRNNTGQWSSTGSQYFIRVPVAGTEPGKKLEACQYWFDDNIQAAQALSLPLSGQQYVAVALPAGALTPGLHTLQVRFRDNCGLWSPVTSQYFYSNAASVSTVNLVTGYRYWFNFEDTSQMVRHLIPARENPLLQRSIDMGCLPAGANRLHLQFSDRKGQWSLPLNDTIQVPVITDKTYRFTGNGNWSNPANWQNNAVPALDLPGCREIIIDHVPGGSCVLDIPQYLLKHARLTVLSGKRLVVPQQLEIR